MSRIAQLSPADRPRERLIHLGAHRLEPPELLALVLGTGRGSGEDVLELAERVIEHLGGLEGVAAAQMDRLQSVPGIGPVKAARIRAAFELALRAGPVEPPAAWAEPVEPPPTARGRRGARPSAEARTALEPSAGAPDQEQTRTAPDAVRAAEVEARAGIGARVGVGARAGVGVGIGAKARAEAEVEAEAGEDAAAAAWLLTAVERLRGQVPTGETALLGVADDARRPPLTLSLGEALGPRTRPGAVLARLIAAGNGPWWLAAVRPAGAPRSAELEAVRRVLDAAELVGVVVPRVVIIGRGGHWQVHPRPAARPRRAAQGD